MITNLMIRTDLTVSLLPIAQQFKDEALEVAALIGTVKNAAMQESAVEALSKIKGVLKMVEESRQDIKRPVLDLAADIDQTAKKFIVALKSEELRISTLIGNFQQDQIAIARRAEQARQEELRKIEEERQAEERKAREQAESKERERQQLEAKLAKESQKAKDEETRLKIEQQRAAIAADRQIEAKAVERQIERNNLVTEQAVMALGPEIQSVRAEGQRVKDTFEYEVTDIQLLQRMHPGFVKMEPRRDEIMLAIASGVREIHGLRIKPVIKIQVKAERQRVIEV